MGRPKSSQPGEPDEFGRALAEERYYRRLVPLKYRPVPMASKHLYARIVITREEMEELMKSAIDVSGTRFFTVVDS